MISPWCSDAAVAIAVVNIGVGVDVSDGVDVDGQDDALHQPKIRFQPGFTALRALWKRGYIDDG